MLPISKVEDYKDSDQWKYSQMNSRGELPHREIDEVMTHLHINMMTNAPLE